MQEPGTTKSINPIAAATRRHNAVSGKRTKPMHKKEKKRSVLVMHDLSSQEEYSLT